MLPRDDSLPSTEPAQGLLPAFTARQYSHLPTPQSPHNIGRYIHDRAYSPESPVPNGMMLSTSSTFQNRRAENMLPVHESNGARSQSSLQQCITPESSPQFPNNLSLDHVGSATPRYFVPPSSIDFSTPKQNLVKVEPTISLGLALPRISTPSSPSSEIPNQLTVLSSPFMAKLSIGDNAAKSSDMRPTNVDDVFSSSQPLPRTSALTAAVSTPPTTPFPPPDIKPIAEAGGEMERIRQSVIEGRLTQIREAEKRRPEYLKRAKRPLSEVEPSLEEEERPLHVGIMETPNRGRRLKLFQETSEESFEESLMAGGYGRYRTADWVRQPQPVSLSSSAIAGSSTIVAILEEAQDAPPSEKELKKRRRLAAFKSDSKCKSKLRAIELEGKGRVLIDVPTEEPVRPESPEPAPSKKKAASRRKKKVNEVVANNKKPNGVPDPQIDKPNWPDTEFPWRLRTEERLELAKAEEEDRLRWIERFLDRDSDDEDEPDSRQLVIGQTAHEISPRPSPIQDRVSDTPLPIPGRGKFVPLTTYPNGPRKEGLVKSTMFLSDPADARAAFLSKRSVRSLSYRQHKRQRELDDEDDDEVVCVCNGKDDGRELVQCDGCQTWYHLRCIGIKNIAELGREEDPWFCRKCVSRSRSPSTEPDIPESEPTFVPTDDEPGFRRSSDTPFFQPSLQESPNWSSSRMPRTPTRGYHGYSDSGSSWIESSRGCPSTPQHPAPAVRIYNSPYDSYNQEESPFDPTSTPSRGIKFPAPFTTPTPKTSNAWAPRMSGGLFQTPSKPGPGIRVSGVKGSSTTASVADDNAPNNVSHHEFYGRVISYDDSPIRRSGDSAARRSLHSRPPAQTLSFLEESPVVRSVAQSQKQIRRRNGLDHET